MAGKRTTLKDVAKAAGVSAMSASKALNNKSGISTETRKQILEVARQLNYRPNMVAKSLRLDETKTLGVVVADSSEMVMSKVLRGIADAAQREDYSILTINTDADSARERRAMEVLINKCIDGILMIAPTMTTREDTVWLHATNTPLVLLMRESMHASIDSVVNDNLRGGYDAVNHLIERGCQSFRFLSLTSVSQIGGKRLEGARLAMQEHGLSMRPDTVRHCLPHIDAAQQAMSDWLDEEPLNCDAIVCGCDIIAIGVMNALLKRGHRIPEDVCLSGYDDIELADYLRVPLTTIRQPLYEIGQTGVEILLERMRNPNVPAQRVVIRSELIARESSQRPEAAGTHVQIEGKN